MRSLVTKGIRGAIRAIMLLFNSLRYLATGAGPSRANYQYGYTPTAARAALIGCHILAWASSRSYQLMTQMPTRWLNRRFFLLTGWFSNRSNNVWGWAIPRTEWGKKRLSEPLHWWFLG